MKFFITTSIVIVGLWSWNPARAQSSLDIGEGARAWANNCTRCHNARSPMEHPDRQWATIVSHMRARANLTRSEARQITAYLQAINAPESPRVAPANQDAVGKDSDSVSRVDDRAKDGVSVEKAHTTATSKTAAGLDSGSSD